MRFKKKPTPIVQTFIVSGVKTTAVRRASTYDSDGQMMSRTRWDCTHALIPDIGFTIQCSVYDEAMDYKAIDKWAEHIAAIKKDLLNLKHKEEKGTSALS